MTPDQARAKRENAKDRLRTLSHSELREILSSVIDCDLEEITQLIWDLVDDMEKSRWDPCTCGKSGVHLRTFECVGALR